MAKEREFEWCSNAPEHWPKLFLGSLPKEKLMYYDPINFFYFIGGFSKAYEKPGQSKFPMRMYRRKLTSEGLLIIPIQLLEDGNWRSVFFYDHRDPASGPHFAAASAILQASGEPAPVYYATGPLALGPGGRCLSAFSIQDLTLAESTPEPGSYAMWWGDSLQCSVLESISKYIRELDGIQTYFTGYLLDSLRSQKGLEGCGRIELPSGPYQLALQGPEDTVFYVTFSEEKGVRFHFNVATTPPAYRNAFWGLLAEFAGQFRKELEARNLELDDARGPAKWWQALRQGTAEELKKQAPAAAELTVGMLSIEESAAIRSELNLPEQRKYQETRAGLLAGFTAEEQQALVLMPLAVFFLVAGADGIVDQAELDTFSWALRQGAIVKTPLLYEITKRMSANFEGNCAVFRSRKVDPLDILSTAQAALSRGLLEAERRNFAFIMLELGQVIAEASGGFLGVFGNKVSKEEAQALKMLRAVFSIGDE